jgi:CheY-like chemotaxis protein
MICDFRMPRIDGPTLARAIREREGQNRDRASAAARRLHIAIISANADIDHASECLAAGVDDFLAKPVAIDVMEALLARVALAVRGHVAGTTQTAASAAPRLPAADAVFDPAVLLRIYGAPHRAHAALSAWVANTEHDLARLSAALERRDMAAVRDIAHRMRGSASVAGAMQLAAAAADLERAAGQAGGPAVPALSELRAAFVAARSAANGFIRPLS